MCQESALANWEVTDLGRSCCQMSVDATPDPVEVIRLMVKMMKAHRWHCNSDEPDVLAMGEAVLKRSLVSVVPTCPQEVNFPEDAVVKLEIYTKRCHSCRVQFNGHKRRVLCRICDALATTVEEEARKQADTLLLCESPEVRPILRRGFVRGFCVAEQHYRLGGSCSQRVPLYHTPTGTIWRTTVRDTVSGWIPGDAGQP